MSQPTEFFIAPSTSPRFDALLEGPENVWPASPWKNVDVVMLAVLETGEWKRDGATQQDLGDFTRTLQALADLAQSSQAGGFTMYLWHSL